MISTERDSFQHLKKLLAFYMIFNLFSTVHSYRLLKTVK